jgi:hypothetical protein
MNIQMLRTNVALCASLLAACNPSNPPAENAATTSISEPSSAASPLTAKAEAVFNSAQCGIEKPEVRWLRDANELAQLASRTQLQDSPVGMDIAVDFGEEQAILVAMGMQPTPGYSLTFVSEQTTVEHIVFTLEWVAPGQGKILPQVITTPCIVIKLPNGTQRSVVIRDTTGTERLTARQ